MGKHVMLSYQWNIQELVEKVYNGLRAMGLNTWMDIHGGVKGDINDRSVNSVNEQIFRVYARLFGKTLYEIQKIPKTELVPMKKIWVGLLFMCSCTNKTKTLMRCKRYGLIQLARSYL